MAAYDEHVAPEDHLDRLCSDDRPYSGRMDGMPVPILIERGAGLAVTADMGSVDPLSPLECLTPDEDTVLEAEYQAVSAGPDRLRSPSLGTQPVEGLSAARFASSASIASADPLSTLENLEEVHLASYDSLNRFGSFGDGLETFRPQQGGYQAVTDENGNRTESVVVQQPSSRDEANGVNATMAEPVAPKPVPNYMSVHRKQPKRMSVMPENDTRIVSVVVEDPDEGTVAATTDAGNTNQSNQGLETVLGYVDDGYSTISKYRDDSGGEEEDAEEGKPAPEAISRLSGALLRERKAPSGGPEVAADSTARYSTCAPGIEINTSRQKIVRDDKVRFGTLDPRKLEDVTPSKFVNGRYVNPWDTWAEPTVTNAIKWVCMRKQGGIPSKEVLNETLPVLTPDLLRIRAPPPTGINVTWLGHASLLVQFDGVSILTDPIFSGFCGPSPLVGVRRYRPIPCEIRRLPKVDAVVISHTHYDHLDLPTVLALDRWYGAALRWFVPLGVLDWFLAAGVENVIELDWWQENGIPSHSGVTFAFTPSQHWSQRTAFDRQRCLWGSWAVIGPNHSFFFAGDTGYCRAFKEIGQRYGPFDLAAIPIGAYLPRFFLGPQHVDPAQAVQIHQDVQARQSVAMHWGTFSLGKEHYLAPKEDLRTAREEQGLTENDFFTLKHGETRLVAAEEATAEEEEEVWEHTSPHSR